MSRIFSQKLLSVGTGSTTIKVIRVVSTSSFHTKKAEQENVIKETHRLIYLWGKVNQTRMRKDFSSYIDRQTTNKYLVRASLNPHS